MQFFVVLLGLHKDYSYFCTTFYKGTRSSMDRIPDSGSDDMGSIPIGCTNECADVSMKTSAHFFVYHQKISFLFKEKGFCLGMWLFLFIFTE